jgi:hypothetical protein
MSRNNYILILWGMRTEFYSTSNEKRCELNQNISMSLISILVTFLRLVPHLEEGFQVRAGKGALVWRKALSGASLGA